MILEQWIKEQATSSLVYRLIGGHLTTLSCKLSRFAYISICAPPRLCGNKPAELKMEEWKLTAVTNGLLQPNENDCGAYILILCTINFA